LSRRRLVTIPGFTLAWLLWLAAVPLWLPAACLLDLARRRGAVALRSSVFLAAFLSLELAGIAASGAAWLWRRCGRIGAERWQDLHFRLEAWWGATLFQFVVRCFSLRVVVEGDSGLARGPYLLLMRHASSGDTLLASALVSRPHDMRLRYVLKRELLWDPCLDIVGNRLPNVFVERESTDSEGEVRKVQELARDLGARDGVLIYPEGTRFSESKRRRVLERLGARGDAKLLEYARSLTSVLPPRVGGTTGLMDAAPDCDVVICAHTGFEGAATLAQIWRGALLHRVIRVHFERVPRAEIPTGGDARVAWLLERWQRVDAWVSENRVADAA
jgi:1-acyl-sn-glycerol-3-phosphate acyltransferase